MAHATALPRNLQALAERTVSAEIECIAALEQARVAVERALAAQRQAGPARYDWTATCMTLAGHGDKDGPVAGGKGRRFA